jgi:hypothetical protein
MLGCVALIRPSSSIMLIFIPIYIGLKTRSALRSVVPILIALLIISLWLVRAYEIDEHKFVPINYANSTNFFIGNNPYTPLYRTWWLNAALNHQAGVPQGWQDLALGLRMHPLDVQDSLYRQVALNYIKSRPDLFLLRTFNRMRAYFAFDTFFGSELIANYSMNKVLGVVILALDASFYLAIMVLALYALFNLRILPVKADLAPIILGIAIVYAFPYWFSFSHPTYHFPVVPLFGAFAAVAIIHLLAKASGRPASAGTAPARPGAGRYLPIALLVFAYIQLEWIFVMYRR